MKRKIDLPLQTQADTQRALLYFLELEADGIISLCGGKIDADKCRAGLAELKKQGIEPNEDYATGEFAAAIAKSFGIELVQ